MGASCHIILLPGSALGAICCHCSAVSGFPGLCEADMLPSAPWAPLYKAASLWRAVCGRQPWKHMARRWQSHRLPRARCPGAPADALLLQVIYGRGCLAVSSISTLPSALCHAAVCGNLLAFDAPSHFLYSYGTVLSPFFVIPLASF